MNSSSGGSMAKAELFLLLLLTLSFALLDPPTMEAHEHNLGIAPTSLLHENALNLSEREPTFSDPVRFIYVRVLTLTPSVNMSVTSKEELHPKLIWLAAEGHERTMHESHDSGGCEREEKTRNYGEMELQGVTASYSIDGIPKKINGNITFTTATSAVVLADNATFSNPSDVPFKRGFSLLCWLTGFSSLSIGGIPILDCDEETLARASPYAIGVYNLTVRNLTVVNPHLNVSLRATFRMNYTEHGTRHFETDDGCESESWDDNGTLTYTEGDSASYEVQNDYMTIIPHSPTFLNLTVSSSEDIVYYFTLLSNSNLYKYYSRMDNKTATAYYIYTFRVVNDSYGTQFIVADRNGTVGLLPEDPESANNYTGPHSLLAKIEAMNLRNPYEITNQTYNFSRTYLLKEMFANLSEGNHSTEFRFHTWFGNYSMASNLSVRSRTMLTLSAAGGANDTVVVTCALTARNLPAAGQVVELKVGNETQSAVTNSLGICSAEFRTKYKVGTASADYGGSDRLLPATATTQFVRPGFFTFGADLLSNNFALMLLLSILVGFSVFNLVNMLGMGPAGGVLVGNVFSRFFPFAPRGVPKGKPMVRVKKGKELAVSVAMALATGGAGAAAGSKIAGAAAKKAAGDAAKKAMEKKMTREMAEKAGKKKAAGAAKRTAKKASAKKKIPAKGITILGKMALQATDEGKYQRDIMEKWKLNEERAKELKEKVQEPHMKVVQEKIDRVVAASDDPAIHARHELNKKFDLKPELRIVGDFDFEHFLVKAYDSQAPYNTLGVTVGNVVYLRHSGVFDEKYIQEVIKHEDYHVVSKLAWDGRTKPLVEGANEIMKYEDVMREQTTNVDKTTVHIIEGNYREYAAQQYLVREIVGENNFVAGHCVMGEEHLQKKFDEVVGEGQYKKIFGEQSVISHEDKITELQDIYEKKVVKTSDELNFVNTNVNSIKNYGKYDVR